MTYEDAENFRNIVKALMIVSFYARINHGDKAKDYGEIVNPVLEALHLPTGEMPTRENIP